MTLPPKVFLVCVLVLAASPVRTTYSSDLLVSGGTFRVEGTLKADNVNVAAPATLLGTGTVVGDSSISGTVAPGNGSATNVGTLTLLGNLTFQSGSTFDWYAGTHTSLDKLVVSGAASGDCTVFLTNAPAAIPINQVIIDGGASSDYTLFTRGGPAPDDWKLEPGGVNDLLVTHLYGDSDSDEIPDWWELAHFSGRTNAVASGDADTDNANNLAEYIAGTLPTNGASCFRVVAIEPLSTNRIVITWSSVTDRKYTLLRATNLHAGVTNILAGDIPGSAPTNSWTNIVGTTNQFFFRIKVRQ